MREGTSLLCTLCGTRQLPAAAALATSSSCCAPEGQLTCFRCRPTQHTTLRPSPACPPLALQIFDFGTAVVYPDPFSMHHAVDDHLHGQRPDAAPQLAEQHPHNRRGKVSPDAADRHNYEYRWVGVCVGGASGPAVQLLG